VTSSLVKTALDLQPQTVLQKEDPVSSGWLVLDTDSLERPISVEELMGRKLDGIFIATVAAAKGFYTSTLASCLAVVPGGHGGGIDGCRRRLLASVSIGLRSAAALPSLAWK